jgi:hypothetical protein
MLIQQPDNAEFIYLQEMISNNFNWSSFISLVMRHVNFNKGD